MKQCSVAFIEFAMIIGACRIRYFLGLGRAALHGRPLHGAAWMPGCRSLSTTCQPNFDETERSRQPELVSTPACPDVCHMRASMQAGNVQAGNWGIDLLDCGFHEQTNAHGHRRSTSRGTAPSWPGIPPSSAASPPLREGAGLPVLRARVAGATKTARRWHWCARSRAATALPHFRPSSSSTGSSWAWCPPQRPSSASPSSVSSVATAGAEGERIPKGQDVG